jgi:uncharacterized protein YsxB (DUF464 family)
MPSLSISGSRSFEKQTALEALRECPHEAIPNIIETAVQFLHCEEATVNKQMHFTAALLICSLVSGCSNVEGTISALAEAESKAENRYSRAFLRIALERLKDGSSQSANLIMRTVRCPFTNFVFPY